MRKTAQRTAVRRPLHRCHSGRSSAVSFPALMRSSTVSVISMAAPDSFFGRAERLIFLPSRCLPRPAGNLRI